MNIIECKNLTKEYISGDNTVKAVNNISVYFEKGEFCAVTGPSGSGKSTFIHMLSSLEYPTSGEVIYDGKSLGKFSDDQLSILRRRRFGFVFQSYNLVQELTGYENILLPVMLDKKKPDEEYLNDIIKTLGISNRIDHLPSAMSGGQQQRIAIARALANKPSILFADEPTGALDSSSATELLFALSEVNQTLGTTILMVTHDPYAASYTDRILYFKDGHIISELKRCNRARQDFYEEIMLEAARQDKQR